LENRGGFFHTGGRISPAQFCKNPSWGPTQAGQQQPAGGHIYAEYGPSCVCVVGPPPKCGRGPGRLKKTTEGGCGPPAHVEKENTRVGEVAKSPADPRLAKEKHRQAGGTPSRAPGTKHRGGVVFNI